MVSSVVVLGAEVVVVVVVVVSLAEMISDYLVFNQIYIPIVGRFAI